MVAEEGTARLEAEESDAPGLVDEAVAEDDEAGGPNCHCWAALRARAEKNWLAAGLASSAEATVPSGLSCTRTEMRTVPLMVARAFSETSGRILRTTVSGAGLVLEAAGVCAGTGVGGGARAAEDESGEADFLEVAIELASGEVELEAGEFLAGAVAGFESANREIGVPGEDFAEVDESAEDL